MTYRFKRGIIYLVWGDSVNAALNRSIESLGQIHPELPFEIIRVEAAPGLSPLKAKMCELSPFDTTLFLDADTVILGNLDFAFERAEQFGIACCICEAPFMRRYGIKSEREQIEYNTGVICFTRAAKPVFDAWQLLADSIPSRSRWRMIEDPPGYRRGLEFDDQAGFARALVACEFNPFVLPINYNLRPNFHRSFFAPVKIWHSYDPVPPIVREISLKVEAGELPITHIQL